MSERTLTRRQLARLNREQRAAYDRLRVASPGPAEQARLKMALDWKRTTEETVALARELLAEGRTRLEVAGQVGVGADYLDRLFKKARTAEIEAKNKTGCRDFSGLAERVGGIGRPDRRTAPIEGFASFADLDRWLEETG